MTIYPSGYFMEKWHQEDKIKRPEFHDLSKNCYSESEWREKCPTCLTRYRDYFKFDFRTNSIYPKGK